NATSYLWTFGDGATSSAVAPWHLYANPGAYYVCLTITISTSSGNCTSTLCDSIHITVPLPPVCNAHFNHYPSSTNADNIHFYPATNTAGAAYFWTFGDGATSTLAEPWHL